MHLSGRDPYKVEAKMHDAIRKALLLREPFIIKEAAARGVDMYVHVMCIIYMQQFLNDIFRNI